MVGRIGQGSAWEEDAPDGEPVFQHRARAAFPVVDLPHLLFRDAGNFYLSLGAVALFDVFIALVTQVGVVAAVEDEFADWAV